MAKANIKIPKGTKCGNGKVCEQDLELDIEIPEINPTVSVSPDPIISIPGTNQQAQQIAPPPIPQTSIPDTPKPRTYTNEELSNLMPPGVNFAVCKGDNCGNEKIQNKNVTTKFKSCPKCGCNNVASNSSICPCCGTNEPQDEEEKEDYWDESEIDLKSDDE